MPLTAGLRSKPEARAARIVQRRLQLDVRIALGRLAVIERGRLPVDLDVALDLIALVVGDDLEVVGLELLVHHQLVGGKAVEIGGDGVGGVRLGQLALDRQAELDVRRERSLAGVGIDRRSPTDRSGDRWTSISAAAGTGPSTRNLVRDGDGFGAMSGTSKTKSEIVTLRPAGVSAMPCPIFTVAVRPVTCAFRSASCTTGMPSTGRTVDAARHDVDRQAVIGNRRPLRGRLCIGELTPTSMRWSVPRSIRSITHSRNSGTTSVGHIRFSAEADIGVPAKPSVSRGSPE